MKKLVLALIATVIFGKLFPLMLLALLLVGLGAIIKAAIEEDKA